MTMIRTPGVYFSIKSSTSAYQEKMMAFIGHCHATKEPTPVCLPTTKAWEWHTGNAIADFAKAEAHYEVEANNNNNNTQNYTIYLLVVLLCLVQTQSLFTMPCS